MTSICSTMPCQFSAVLLKIIELEVEMRITSESQQYIMTSYYDYSPELRSHSL